MKSEPIELPTVRLRALREDDAVHLDVSFFDSFCRRGSGERREAGDGSVQPFSRLFFGYQKYHGFFFSFFSWRMSRIRERTSSPAPTQTKESAPLNTAK